MEGPFDGKKAFENIRNVLPPGLRQRRPTSETTEKVPLIKSGDSIISNDTNTSSIKSSTVVECSKETHGNAHEPSPSDKYILVGYKSEFDFTKSFLEFKKLHNNEGREIYCVSFITVMPTEVFLVLDRKLGYNRRFYPQGKQTQKYSRTIEADETFPSPVLDIPNKKFWILDGVKPGEEVSVYFAPVEKTLVWTTGPLNKNFNMPPPKENLSADDVSAVTQFQIDNSTGSNILLMASDITTRYMIAIFRLVPHVIMILLITWIYQSAPKQTSVKFYTADTHFEWMNVLVIYFANVMRKAFDVGEQWTAIQQSFALACKIRNDKSLARGLQFGAVVELLNLLQDPFAFILSLYVAVYLSDDVFLNVLLNVVALEFITDIDEDMVAAYTSWKFGEDATISVALLDISYSVDETIDLWHESSDTSPKKVQEDLRMDDASNATRWQLLISKTKGLGLLDTMGDGRKIVDSIMVEIDVINWDIMPRTQLVHSGGLYLAATPNKVWEQYISKHQRAVLFRHFPELAMTFPWVGSVKLDEVTLSHAHFIVQIANDNPDVTAVSCNLDCRESVAMIEVLSAGLAQNKTLQTLSLCHSGITGTGAMELAKLLRKNSTLEFIWLISNRGIGDDGALDIAAALSEGSDANTTLHRIYFGVNSISTECQAKCIEKTNGRMIFQPDDHPFCAYFLSLESSNI